MSIVKQHCTLNYPKIPKIFQELPNEAEKKFGGLRISSNNHNYCCKREFQNCARSKSRETLTLCKTREFGLLFEFFT